MDDPTDFVYENKRNYWLSVVNGTSPNWHPNRVPAALEMLKLIEESSVPCKNCGSKECYHENSYCASCLRALMFWP